MKRTIMVTLRSLALVLFALFATGCVPKKPATTIAPPPPAPEGKTRYSYIFDPTSAALSLPTDVKFYRPQPVDTKTLPKYPERALAARDAPHREIVRIVIDTHGNVDQVLDSPMGRSDEGPFAADYRRAVDYAVRMWRYEPGHLLNFKGGPDRDGDGKPDYKIMTSSDPIAVYYDIRFTFEIAAGKGVVTKTP